jgi:hypothetical protein
LPEKRQQGEWFQLPTDDIEAFKRIAIPMMKSNQAASNHRSPSAPWLEAADDGIEDNIQMNAVYQSIARYRDALGTSGMPTYQPTDADPTSVPYRKMGRVTEFSSTGSPVSLDCSLFTPPFQPHICLRNQGQGATAFINREKVQDQRLLGPPTKVLYPGECTLVFLRVLRLRSVVPLSHYVWLSLRREKTPIRMTVCADFEWQQLEFDEERGIPTKPCILRANTPH